MDSKPPRLTGSPMLVVKRKLRETWSQAVESPSAWSLGAAMRYSAHISAI